ncbi:MAG TPA: cysteine desulfurase family protein [Myxococcota bacterium]|nr:cysteine desulfurase family protein [Myxococcota bacterium]
MRIYLDHNATTPPRAEVVAAMSEALRANYGNPSSTHAEGAAARAAIERARGEVAALVGAAASDVIFTAGATEANNTALLGALAARPERRHVVSTTIEHPSVEAPLAAAEVSGARVTRVAVDAAGRLDLAALERAIDDETALVAVILANNETGVIQDVPRIAAAAHARGAWLHVDATQAVGKIPVNAAALGADLLACSAHKLNGPKGTGCLVARKPAVLPAYLLGGGQERRRRGGTENVAGIAGFGVACALARAELAERGPSLAALRDRLWSGIEAKIPRVRRNGDARCVLPNTLSVEFDGVAGEVLLEALDGEGIAVSAGAACHSGSVEPSAVLIAMGRTPAQARASLRFSVGHGNTAAEIDHVLSLLPELVARVRAAGA